MKKNEIDKDKRQKISAQQNNPQASNGARVCGHETAPPPLPTLSHPKSLATTKKITAWCKLQLVMVLMV